MTPDASDWTAPEITPLSDTNGASTHPNARIRNGDVPSPSPTVI